MLYVPTAIDTGGYKVAQSGGALSECPHDEMSDQEIHWTMGWAYFHRQNPGKLGAREYTSK